MSRLLLISFSVHFFVQRILCGYLQDDEYLASLAADREKELRAIQEAEAQRVREQEAAAAAESEEQLRREEEKRQKEEAEELERQLTAKKGKLPMEPAADAEGAVTLVVRLPDGSRRGRRFHKSNKLQVSNTL